MYDYVKGEVVELTPTYAVIEAGGIGYFVNISLHTYTCLGSAKSALLYLHLAIREDAHTLYGFYERGRT